MDTNHDWYGKHWIISFHIFFFKNNLLWVPVFKTKLRTCFCHAKHRPSSSKYCFLIIYNRASHLEGYLNKKRQKGETTRKPQWYHMKLIWKHMRLTETIWNSNETIWNGRENIWNGHETCVINKQKKRKK